jgi:hypothetical protein
MRRLLPNGIAAIVAFALLAVGAAGTAIAYFTTTGAGDSAPTGISQLAKPTIATATPAAGGTVALTWGAVTAPGPGAVTYSVSRDGKEASGTCTPLLTVVSCTDSGLEPGTYTYVVTAKWRSWTATGSAKAATVTVGPADHLVLGAASLTPAAGAADNLTVTAKDAKGSTVTTYAGSHNLTFSGAPNSPSGTVPTVADSAGTPVAFGSATALNFTAGVATVSASTNGVTKLYAKGEANLAASDGSISTAAPLAVTVAAATAAKFALAAASATPTAGEADNLTITALDAYGNLAITYTGSHSLTFSGALASPGGNTPTVANSSGTAVNFGSATALTFTAGVATVSSGKNGAMKLYRAESPSIAASEGTITTAVPLEVTVAPTSAAKFVLGATTTTPTAGTADSLTTTAQDTYGNVATAYTGPRSLTFSGAVAGPNGAAPTVSDSTGADIAFGSATAINFSAGVAAVSGAQNGAMKLYKSGSTSLKVTDGTLLTPTALVVTVAAAPAVKFTLSGSVTNLTAGGSSNLTTTALDTYGNTATAYTGSHNLTFSGAATVGTNKPTVANSSGTATAFGTATAISFTAGVATVTSSKNGLMKIYASGEADVEATDGSISTTAPLEVTVTSTTAAKFVLTAATATPTAGETDNLTTTVQDTYGNVATTYTGSHSLTFSGASASPSGAAPTVSDSTGADTAFGSATAINFSAGVATASGVQNGATKLYKSGSASLKVTDGTLLTPTALVVTVAAAPAVKFTLSASATTLVAGGSSNLTTTALDTYGNTATSYAGSHNVTFNGAGTSPNGTAPTVVNSSGTAVNFGGATALTFTAGVAAVSSSKNGLMKLYRAESLNISVTDGSISSVAPVAATVSPTTASKWALTNINVSAGALGSNCLFTCTLTGLGNSGTVTAKVAVADTYGNTVSALGSGHAAKVTPNGTGTIGGTPLAIPSAGAAESATTFTFTSRSSGSFTEVLTVATSEGTSYTSATLTATK